MKPEPGHRDSSAGDGGALRELLEKTNVCVVDLDQCVYPGFTQTTLAALLLLASIRGFRPRRVYNLLRGAFSLALIRLFRAGRGPDGNRRLMTAFSAAIRGMDASEVETASARLPGRGPQDWRAALEKLAEKMEVFLITFAIEPLARAYGSSRGPSGKIVFSAWSGSSLNIRDGKVEGVGFTAAGLSPRSKVAAAGNLLEGRANLRPLVIGHGRDESELAAWARDKGGGSIGLAAAGGDLEAFDLVLPGRGWPAIGAALSKK